MGQKNEDGYLQGVIFSCEPLWALFLCLRDLRRIQEETLELSD